MKRGLRILMVTQIMDSRDDVLGFVHGWAEKLSQRLAKLYIIALFVGEHHLPENVTVMSMGKDKGRRNKFRYALRFYSKTLGPILRRRVDVVFIHMNYVYVFLLAPFAKLARVPIVLWYAHGHVSFGLRVATRLVDAVATSSEAGFRVEMPKRRVVGQGIDTEIFKPSGAPDTQSKKLKLLCVSRISQVKGYDTLLEAGDILINKKAMKDLEFTIIGSPKTKADESYFENLKARVQELGLSENFNFLGSVPHDEMPQHYNNCDIFINPGRTGSLDKTVLEAMACGRLVVTSNIAYKPVLERFGDLLFFDDSDSKGLAERVERLANLGNSEKISIRGSLRRIVIQDHDIDSLATNLTNLFDEVAS